MPKSRQKHNHISSFSRTNINRVFAEVHLEQERIYRTAIILSARKFRGDVALYQCFINKKRDFELGLTIELILNDVVEDFKEEENELVVVWSRIEEPGLAEGFREVQQLRR